MSEYDNHDSNHRGLRGELMRLYVVLLIHYWVGVFGFCGMSVTNVDAQATQSATSNKISTRLSLPTHQFTIGQDVIVTLMVKNISSESIPFRTTPHSYRVYVEGTNGEVEKTRFYAQLRGEVLAGESGLALGGVTLEIQPGKSDTKDFNLTQYYKLQEPGKYRTYVECDDESGTWVRSNVVSFELKAAN